MGKLIYLNTTSIDGYAADSEGNIDWSEPTEEILAYINDVLANVGTFLLGRKMLETLAVWDTIKDSPSAGTKQFADIWHAANKIVYSSQLVAAQTKDTAVERVFDPEAVRRKVAESYKDFDIGGPHLAAAAIKADIIDEYHQIIVPIMLGSGTHWLPKDTKLNLKLAGVRQFDNGAVHLQYDKV